MEKDLERLQIIADQRFDGKYTITCINGSWKGAFGEPSLHGNSKLHRFSSLEDLLADLLFNETSFEA